MSQVNQIICPPISDGLMRYLESVFPDRSCNPEKVNPHVAYGSVKVVRHLKAVQETQEEAI